MARFSGDESVYLKPKTLDEALSALGAGSTVLAGGTDFFPALGDRVPQGRIVDITGLREMRGISFDPGWIRIGALTTWTEIIRAQLPRCLAALQAAAKEIGSVQIQNRGTVAGNLCNASPAADGVPPLLALDAEVELSSAANQRRLPLAKFIAGNRKTLRGSDELLTAVFIPRAIENARSAFLKLGARRYLVISISMVAVVLQTDQSDSIADARVAVGSCSVTAKRLRSLEEVLIGRRAEKGIAAALQPEHLAPLSPIDDVRATAEYRRDASLTLVRRALAACVEAV